MSGRRIPLHEWPEIGEVYHRADEARQVTELRLTGDRVEVRAVSCSHVVCDDEQVFALEEFTKKYTRAAQ